jgi:hypothetical protein
MLPTPIAGINGTRLVDFIFIFSFNIASGYLKLIFIKKDLLVDVTYDGTVSCTPTALINVACKTDISNFPFDEKICSLSFAR